MLQLMQKPITDSDQPSKHWNALLVSVAKNQDLEAFQALFDHFAPLIKAYARRVSDPSQSNEFAEELAQETMVKIWLKAKSFNSEKASASTWIFTVARNTRIDMIRKNFKHSDGSYEFDENTLEADDVWSDNTQGIEDEVAASQHHEIINNSIALLPAEQIDVIKALFLEGLSHSEAAKLLNLPLGTVKSRVRLALQKLKLSIDI
jgi:RNA polymerase sigma-70 factor (ECF subfamily)